MALYYAVETTDIDLSFIRKVEIGKKSGNKSYYTFIGAPHHNTKPNLAQLIAFRMFYQFLSASRTFGPYLGIDY